MKKVALFTLVALLVAAFVPTFAAGPVYDDLPDLEGAEVVFAMENFYTPYQFVDPRDPSTPIGFEYDLINEVCNRINCSVVVETTTFELQLSGVQAGEYDAAVNGLFITEERQEIYDFSVPYTRAEAYVLARAGEDRFTGLANFAEVAAEEELIIGIQPGSFGQFLVAPDWYAVPESQVVSYDEFGALLTALENGDIDAMVVDAFGGRFVSEKANIFELIGEPVADPVDVGIIFTKGSEFAPAFSAAIESMKADGYLDFLHYKWSVDFVPLAES